MQWGDVRDMFGTTPKHKMKKTPATSILWMLLLSDCSAAIYDQTSLHASKRFKFLVIKAMLVTWIWLILILLLMKRISASIGMVNSYTYTDIYIYQINNARLYKHRHFIPVTFTACGTTAMRSRRSVKGTWRTSTPLKRTLPGQSGPSRIRGDFNEATRCTAGKPM